MLPTLKRFKIQDLRFKIGQLEFLTSGIFLILLGLALILFAKSVRAQVPPGPQPCGVTASPEFHTFRPYQADPCNPDAQDLALFCGNDLVITDTITVRRSDAFNCYYMGNGKENCIFEVNRILDLAIDVSGAKFPIMGNTEGISGNKGVINSQDQTIPEQIDTAEKVNEYVSWYLNGVTNAPEYGGLNPNKPEDLDKIVNYSGPIKKLLPHRKQRDFIEEQIRSLGPDPDDRHNQVVGCINALSQPTNCYENGGLRGFPITEVRLRDWLAAGRLPPKEEDFPTFNAWWLEYQNWRGQSCISIFGINICIDNPFNRNFWANLYFQIPQSSTEDRKGLVEVVNPVVQPVTPGMVITVNGLVTTPADLFFAHQEESLDLADILQSTFVPKGETKSGPVSSVSPAEYCDLTQVRSNPGDDLFAGEIGVNVNYTANFSCEFDFNQPPDPVDRYLCSELYGGECVTDDYDCDARDGRLDCPSGWRCGRGCDWHPPNPSCTQTASVILNTITETPLTDDIWSRLVAGPMGVFKRIFPKVEPGAPIEGILDIPGATGVNFSLINPPSGVSLSAGNPSNQRSALELYFPHVGGIHEYFLKCIQQALRPQGFGEGCLSGAPGTQATQVDCDPNVPDSAIPSAYRGNLKTNFLDLANRWTTDCPGADNNLAGECYNDTVRQAEAAGVNPAVALTIWLEESGASNYCHGGSSTRDFGINDASIFQNWGEQLSRFLVLPFSGLYSACKNQPGWNEGMHAFLSRLVIGGCDPTSQCGNSYVYGGPCGSGSYAGILPTAWQWVTGTGVCTSGSPPNQRFSISWPTDNSCP